MTILQRFFSKIKRVPSGCWEWQNSCFKDGYGQFWCKPTNVRAHRWVFFFFNPEKSRFLQVRHSCDNRKCCNIRHLLIGTHLDNMKDRTDRKRGCTGEESPHAKLTEDKVREARYRYENTDALLVELAEEYGVNNATMWNALTGETWKHVK